MRRINYRDLSVQQLGSIYERLLENELVVADGMVQIADDGDARHGSGSYYTPEEPVQLIIAQAVGPLVRERMTSTGSWNCGKPTTKDYLRKTGVCCGCAVSLSWHQNNSIIRKNGLDGH